MEAYNQETLATKARRIYDERLKQALDPDSRGQFIAIEADSGDYFLGSTPLEAIQLGRIRHPRKSFHVMKVGHKAAISLKGGIFQWRLR